MNKFNINIFVVSNFLQIRRGYIISKSNLAYTIWWWQFGCKDEWTPESNIKLGSDVKIRSMHEEEVFNMWVDCLITWYNPNYVMLSIRFPSKVDLSWQCHLLDLALKSPITTTRKGFLWTIFSRVNSKFLEKFPKMSKVWLGDL